MRSRLSAVALPIDDCFELRFAFESRIIEAIKKNDDTFRRESTDNMLITFYFPSSYRVPNSPSIRRRCAHPQKLRHNYSNAGMTIIDLIAVTLASY